MAAIAVAAAVSLPQTAVAVPNLSAAAVLERTQSKPVPVLGVIRTTSTFSTDDVSLRYTLRHVSGISGMVHYSNNRYVEMDSMTRELGEGSLQLIAFMAAYSGKKHSIYGIQNVITVVSEKKNANGVKNYIIVPEVEIYKFEHHKPVAINTEITGWGQLKQLNGKLNLGYIKELKTIVLIWTVLSGKLSTNITARGGIINLFFTQRIGGDTFPLDNVHIGKKEQFEGAKIISDPKDRLYPEGGYVGAGGSASFIPASKRFFEEVSISTNGKDQNIKPVVDIRKDNTDEHALGVVSENKVEKSAVFRDGASDSVLKVVRKFLEKNINKKSQSR